MNEQKLAYVNEQKTDHCEWAGELTYVNVQETDLCE